MKAAAFNCRLPFCGLVSPCVINGHDHDHGRNEGCLRAPNTPGASSILCPRARNEPESNVLRDRELGRIFLEPSDSVGRGVPKILPSIQSQLLLAAAEEPHNESGEGEFRCKSEPAQMREPRELKQLRSPTTILISCLSCRFVNYASLRSILLAISHFE